MASRLYKEGSDIIYAVAGGTGNGVIRRRARREICHRCGFQPGSMAPGQVLTSMMKRLDVAVLG